MIITYLGNNYLRFQVGDLIVSVNPSSFNKQKSVKFNADIVISSVNNDKLIDYSLNSKGDDETFFIKGPGYYETNGLSIRGESFFYKFEDKILISTAYRFVMDDIVIGLIGFIDEKDRINDEIRDLFSEIDILFIPLGTGLAPSSVYQLAKSFTPGIIIPTGAIEDSIVRKVFFDEAGSSPDPIDKLTIKSKDLIGKEAEIIYLSS